MGKKRMRRVGLLALPMSALLLVSGCASSGALAPVVNAWQQPQAAGGFYRVRPGDTLYSIAWQFGLDYRALAQANDLKPPYTIEPGEELTMIAAAGPAAAPSSASVITSATAAPETVAKPEPSQTPSTAKIKPRATMVSAKSRSKPKNISAKVAPKWSTKPVSGWAWPAKGKIIGSFSTRIGGNQGIDISGKYGEPIKAAASGRVVYSGSGVRGYGNLIIIKHTDSYLSAYAYNKRNLVTDGAWVQRGQTIALMGRNTAGRVMLHFEIRKNGQPVNPLNYLRQG